MLGDRPTPGRGLPHRRQAARHRSGPPSAPPAVPRPAGTGAEASGTSPARAVGASQSLDRGSPQRSSPTLPRLMLHAEDSVGLGKVTRAQLYPREVTKESEK